MPVKVVSTASAPESSEVVKEIKKQAAREKKSKKKREKQKEIFSKNTIGIMRTKLRNNIELTSIADNKANVLLSLNALMLTFIVPFALPYMELVTMYHLEIPLLILVATCLATVYLAVLVLRPGKFSGQRITIEEQSQISPFFFGNFERMTKDEYIEYSNDTLRNDHLVHKFLSNDFYHIGARLSQKMRLIRRAFNIFIIGLGLSSILTVILAIIYS